MSSPKWPNFYSLPGGHIKKGESIKEAIEREVQEELNLRITPLEFLWVEEAINSSEFYRPCHFIFLNYLCLAESPQDIKVDGKEIKSYIWVKPEEAGKLNLNTPTRKTVEIYLGRSI